VKGWDHIANEKQFFSLKAAKHRNKLHNEIWRLSIWNTKAFCPLHGIYLAILP